MAASFQGFVFIRGITCCKQATIAAGKMRAVKAMQDVNWNPTVSRVVGLDPPVTGAER